MYYVKETFVHTLEIKQSKFIAYLIPFSLYKETLKNLKTSNPKARHFVIAYRYLNKYDQIVEHSSDDGEPSGTSGKPSLIVLQANKIINSALIIVRYFGGTKLGTGGLVRAYSDAVNLVIDLATQFEYSKVIYKKISMAYSDLRMIDYECKSSKIDIYEKFYEDKVRYSIKGSEANIEKFIKKLHRIIEII
jgi:uncharacterized YigZ family protein